jgi:hypothetical protein
MTIVNFQDCVALLGWPCGAEIYFAIPPKFTLVFPGRLDVC